MKKNLLWKKCILFLLLSIGIMPVIFYDEIFAVKNNEQQNQINIDDYYIQSSEMTNFIKDNIQLLIDNYPKKYNKLKPKLEEYNNDMKITVQDVNNKDQLAIKGWYNLIYSQELFEEIRNLGITEEQIVKDYEELNGNSK